MRTPSLSRRTLLRGSVAAGVAAGFVPFAAKPAAAYGNDGLVAMVRDGVVWLAVPTEMAPIHDRVVGNNAVSNVAWASDGSRFGFTNSGAANPDEAGIWTRRADDLTGASFVQVTKSGEDRDLWFSEHGRLIYFSRNGRIHAAAMDGSQVWNNIINYSGLNVVDRHPTVAFGKPMLFERRINGGPPGIYRYIDENTAELLFPNAKCPAYSVGGLRFLYIKTDENYGPGELWYAYTHNLDTSKLGLGLDYLYEHATWAPSDSGFLATVESGTPGGMMVRIGSPVLGRGSFNGKLGSQQSVNKENDVIRAWGNLALDTAIAISRFNWADHSAPSNPDSLNRLKAQAVVVGRGDEYYDALAGSALAANKYAPLLITPPASLYSGAQAELQRVLAPGGTVYLLGGPMALSTTVEQQIKALGYVTVRCGGADMFDTAVKINEQITGLGVPPQMVIVATGFPFYDALAAGAAAGAYLDSVVVLTDGARMPDHSASYLNALNPAQTYLVAAGGPGHAALLDAIGNGQLPNWSGKSYDIVPLVGDDAIHTALLLARNLFSAPQLAAIATSAGWYDALTGGAMSGNNYGPLLVTPPTHLDSRVAKYLNDNSANLAAAVVLGGRAALPDSLIAPIGDNLGLPGGYMSYEVQPSSGSATAGSSAARSAAAPDQYAKRRFDPSWIGSKPQPPRFGRRS